MTAVAFRFAGSTEATLTLELEDSQIVGDTLQLTTDNVCSLLEPWADVMSQESGHLYGWSAEGNSEEESFVLLFSDSERISAEWWAPSYAPDFIDFWFDPTDAGWAIEWTVNP